MNESIFYQNVTNIYKWLYIIIIILQSIITAWGITGCFKLRVSNFSATVLMVISNSISVIPQELFGCVIPLKPIIVYGLTAVVLVLIIHKNESKLRALLFFIICFVIQGFLELFLIMICEKTGFYHFVVPDFSGTPERTSITIIFTLVYALIMYLYVNLWKKVVNKEENISYKRNYILFIFPVGTAAITSLSLIEHELGNFPDKKIMLVYFIAFFIVIITNIVFLYFVSSLEKKGKAGIGFKIS